VNQNEKRIQYIASLLTLGSSGGGGGGTINGTIASTQVAFGTSADTIGGDNSFTFNSTTNVLTVSAINGLIVEIIDAGETIAIGNVLRLATSADAATAGTLIKADASSYDDALVVGIATDSGNAGDSIKMVMTGQQASVLFGSAPLASDNGKRVYLSTTSGQATLTAPTGPTDASVLLGYLLDADGISTTPTVLLKIGEPIAP